MADRITFVNKINDSVQVGDELYYSTVSGTTISAPIKAGPLVADDDGNLTVPTVSTVEKVEEKSIEVDTIASSVIATDFFSFKKVNISTTNAGNVTVNSYSKSGTKGYYASVKMSTSETTKTKLFALGSEVAVSSK